MDSTTKANSELMRSRPRQGLKNNPSRSPGTPKGQARNQNEDNLIPDDNGETHTKTCSPTESDIASMLTIPPFEAPQVQMILWFSWTTTATADKIAQMHNDVFPPPSRHQMTRWHVLDIENDIAMHWRDLARSVHAGRKPTSLPLLTPPGPANPWSCLCKFGVEDCWNHKRDGDSDENLVKLTLARMMWDAVPKVLVRCPYGRRRPPPPPPPKEETAAEQSSSSRAADAASKSTLCRLGSLSEMTAVIFGQWRCFLFIVTVWMMVSYIELVCASTNAAWDKAWIVDQLVYTGITGMLLSLGFLVGCDLAVAISVLALTVWVFSHS